MGWFSKKLSDVATEASASVVTTYVSPRVTDRDDETRVVALRETLRSKSVEELAKEKENKEAKEAEMKRLIEEIHQSFFTEVDKLLAESKILHSLTSDQQEQIDKHMRLRALGFGKAENADAVQKEISRLEALKAENVKKNALSETISYFSTKYPNYKFITEASVKTICEKYGLIYGSVTQYIGNVPEKNLREIENFKIHEEDKCGAEVGQKEITLEGTMERDPLSGRSRAVRKVIPTYRYMSLNTAMYNRDNSVSRHFRYEECGMEIAAPKKDFTIAASQYIVGNKIVSKPIDIPDPVVLYPVFHNGAKHYLIVTAWGLEASDPLVVNERNN